MTAPKPRHLLEKVPWSSEEDAAIRVLYPQGVRGVELLAHFPGRNTITIQGRASVLGVRRLTRIGRPAKCLVEVRDCVEGKTCVGCTEWRPIERFARHQECVGGRRNTCTTCEGRRAYKANPERSIESVRLYRLRHPARSKTIARRASARRRVRIASGDVFEIRDEDLEALIDGFDGRCAYCGDPACSFDHVIPIAKGGEDRIENLLPACRPCNSSKKDKTLDEWAGRRGTALHAERAAQ
jgi:5-methylcytosine-specific restriction endonuclease McrA